MSEITPNTPNPVREDAYKQQLAAKLGIDPKYIPGSPIWHSEEEIAAIAEMFSNMAGGGSGGGALVLHADENGALDKTWKQISDAVENGTIPYELADKDGVKYVNILSEFSTYEDGGVTYYYVRFGQNTPYVTDSENGYPSASGGGGGAI